MAHLHVGKDAPPEYVEFILCRDVYHCTPQALREIPIADVMTALTCLKAEGKIRKLHG